MLDTCLESDFYIFWWLLGLPLVISRVRFGVVFAFSVLIENLL